MAVLTFVQSAVGISVGVNLRVQSFGIIISDWDKEMGEICCGQTLHIPWKDIMVAIVIDMRTAYCNICTVICQI